MYLIYKPEGAEEPTRYEFNPGRVRTDFATALLKEYRRITGNPQAAWAEFKEIACPAGDPAAMRLMLWACQRADHPGLKFVDVPIPFVDEVEVELGERELVSLRKMLADTPRDEDGLRDVYLAQLDAQIAALNTVDGKSIEDGVIDGEATDDDLGKAPSSTGSLTSITAT